MFAATVAACGGVQGTEASRSTHAVSQGVSSPPSAAATGGPTTTLDMEAIFPPGAGRDLVLNNCLTCHSFVRFVLLQRTPEQWAYTKRTMRPQVPHLSDAEADRLFGYLEQHFNDHTPVPVLPEWFLRSVVW